MPVAGAPTVASPRPVTPTEPSASQPAALELGHLRLSNRRLDEILKANPGLQKFLERNAAAIHRPKPGDVQTKFDWPVWTHSPKSSSLVTKANERDIIVIWQEVPGSRATVQFGSYSSYPGEIIAVHQLNLRDGGPVSPATAYDQGYIWPNMTSIASGAKGQPAKLRWAIVDIDSGGKVRGGGYPGGWAGRSFDGVHGTQAYISLKD